MVCECERDGIKFKLVQTEDKLGIDIQTEIGFSGRVRPQEHGYFVNVQGPELGTNTAVGTVSEAVDIAIELIVEKKNYIPKPTGESQKEIEAYMKDCSTK